LVQSWLLQCLFLFSILLASNSLLIIQTLFVCGYQELNIWNISIAWFIKSYCITVWCQYIILNNILDYHASHSLVTIKIYLHFQNKRLLFYHEKYIFSQKLKNVACYCDDIILYCDSKYKISYKLAYRC